MQQLKSFADSFLDHAMRVVTFPLNSGTRIYVLYLLSSVLIAFAIYVVKSRKSNEVEGERSFIGFLFPKKVWSHPSAWLDVRYFFFHQLVGHFLMLGLFAGSAALAYSWTIGDVSAQDPSAVQPLTGWKGTAVAFAYMTVFFLVSDFIGFYMHYLQHKIPILWQFHKVHHSAEVMHPLSNFREHPVDNFVYKITIGMGAGAVTGLFFRFMGYSPSLPSLLGVPILMFLFNVVGYNLRHSHIWLRWPGVWSKVFPSPAHHHVHHSCHPDHLDKNFAFMFPFWDVLFGTYVMPEDNKDVKFGVTEKDRGKELNTCMKLYFIPFKDAWRVLRSPKKPAKPPQADDEINRHPAE